MRSFEAWALVYEPQYTGLMPAHVKDWDKFTKGMREHKGEAARLWDLLDQRTRDAFDSEVILGPATSGATSDLRGRIVMPRLRSILDEKELYKRATFDKVPVSKEIKSILKQADPLTRIQKMQLNREYLTVAFPGAFDPTPDDYHSVRVRVTNGKRVVLVLSSYKDCRWRIETENKSEVAGVILVGYHTQEAFGVNAPFIYRTHHDLEGKATEVHSVHAHEKTHRNYDSLMNLIKELAGRGPDTFQGDYTAPNGGYNIPAKK